MKTAPPRTQLLATSHPIKAPTRNSSILDSELSVAATSFLGGNRSVGESQKSKNERSLIGSKESESSRESGDGSRHSLAASKFSTRRNKANLSEVERLELENKQMEERLIALKDTLSKQKEKRGIAESIWKGGNQQRGSLNAYAVDVLQSKKQAKKRFSGVAHEAAQQLHAFESAMEVRLNQLDALHSQATGAAGLPPDFAALPQKAAGSAQPQLRETTQEKEHFITARPPPLPTKADITPAPPACPPPASMMWRVPSRSSTPQTEPTPTTPSEDTFQQIETKVTHSSSFTTNEESQQLSTTSSFLANLQSWTATAAATAAELPNSKALPEGILKVRRSRIKVIQPPPPPDTSEENPTPNVKQPAAAFDEQESHNSFLAALEEWRNAGKTEKLQKGETSNVEEGSKGGGRFLAGSFDEGESRASFLDALQKWRNGDTGAEEPVKAKAKVADESIGMSTIDTFDVLESGTKEDTMSSTLKMLNLGESSLSYLDKLLLTRYRTSLLDEDRVKEKTIDKKVRFSLEENVKIYNGRESDDDDSEDFVADVFWPPQLNNQFESREKMDFNSAETVKAVTAVEVQILSTEFGTTLRTDNATSYLVEEPVEELYDAE